MLWVGLDGLLHKHRKLMPTQHERLFHGIGRGDDLRVIDTTCGRIGGLICWENRMPLARYAVYRPGPQTWVAPTADDSDVWIAHMRAIAIESGAFVIAVHDSDLRRGLHAKRLFDAVGHYSRDVLDGLVGATPAERGDGGGPAAVEHPA